MTATSFVRTTACAVAALLVGSSIGSAQAPAALKVKLGLWETTTTSKMSGTPPGMDTSKMPPEQRARVEAMMKGMMQNAMAPHTTRSCLTQEKLNKSMFENTGDTCKQTVVTNTATVYAFKVECSSGRGPAGGEWRFEASTPESVAGTGHMTMASGMEITSTMTGKWISASCGDVK